MIFSQLINNVKARLELSMQLAACGLRASFKSDYSSFPIANKLTHQVNIFAHTPDTNEIVRFTGLSTATAEIASKKAFSEFLEAIAYYDSGTHFEQSRSEWATGSSHEEAAHRAYIELIERDSFLSHFLHPHLKSTPEACPEFSLELVKLQSIDESITVFMAASKVNGYYFIGLGASKIEFIAKEKAILEAFMLQSDWQPYSDKYAPKSGREKMLWQHWQAGQNPDVLERIKFILLGGGDRHMHSGDSIIDECIVRFQKQHSGKHQTVSLYHPSLLRLTFGDSWRSYQSEAISLMNNRGLDISSGTWPFHPLL